MNQRTVNDQGYRGLAGFAAGQVVLAAVFVSCFSARSTSQLRRRCRWVSSRSRYHQAATGRARRARARRVRPALVSGRCVSSSMPVPPQNRGSQAGSAYPHPPCRFCAALLGRASAQVRVQISRFGIASASPGDRPLDSEQARPGAHDGHPSDSGVRVGEQAASAAGPRRGPVS
jgi:hypothetical protein